MNECATPPLLELMMMVMMLMVLNAHGAHAWLSWRSMLVVLNAHGAHGDVDSHTTTGGGDTATAVDAGDA